MKKLITIAVAATLITSISGGASADETIKPLETVKSTVNPVLAAPASTGFEAGSASEMGGLGIVAGVGVLGVLAISTSSSSTTTSTSGT